MAVNVDHVRGPGSRAAAVEIFSTHFFYSGVFSIILSLFSLQANHAIMKSSLSLQ